MYRKLRSLWWLQPVIVVQSNNPTNWASLICWAIAFASIATPNEAIAQESDSGSGQPTTKQDLPEFNRGENTQEETSPPLTDQQALNAWQVPDGFELTLFASAPMISQPIAATFDHRGRMWLAENYTYSERPNIFQRDKSDRILVLEDLDQDGHADEVKVFWDGAKLLSSVEVGMGGVWALCAPNLVFIPDADGDAIADGPPQIILDGFEDNEVGHNMVNGLRWGPDGWLYGRHGIQATSFVGRPGTEKEKRTALNCCIWRYHPVASKFEVVCQGTTNSWGHDWTTDGELFFINTVIGHLWHAVPNSHFERMYGEDLTPYTFELTAQVADHVHWDASKERWQDVQDATSPATMQAGGGHAHSGMLICQGELWPDELQGDVLTVNYHGRRINRDQLQRDGSTFIGTHQPDLMQTDDVWFRGIDLIHGPNDSMYILDWSDLGECHENDGVHRTSGRIYRLTKTDAKTSESTSEPFNFLQRTLADSPFVQRTARQRLQKLAFGDSDTHVPQMKNMQATLRNQLGNGNATQKLRALWALNSMGAVSKADLLDLLESSDPTLRRWAVRLLSDNVFFTTVGDRPVIDDESKEFRIPTLKAEVATALLNLSESETDSLVLVYLAAAMRNMNVNDRWTMALKLSQQEQYADDRVFPLLIWYGLEPAVTSNRSQLNHWIQTCKIPTLNRFIARRLAIEHTFASDSKASPLSEVIQLLVESKEGSARREILAGIADGLRGWNRLPTPANWQSLLTSANSSGDDQAILQEINLAFGDQISAEQLIAIVNNGNQSLPVRGNALESIGRSAEMADNSESPEQAQIRDTLLKYLPDRFLGASAAKGIYNSKRSDWLQTMLEQYGRLHSNTRPVVLALSTEKTTTANQLLQAIESETIPRTDMTPYLLRQLQLLGDSKIEATVVKLWPERKLLQQDQLSRIAELKQQLTPGRIDKGNLETGHQLFVDNCSKCHKLFGEGESVGPELTGGQRSNLTYWLQNILAPSAEVGTGFRMSIVLLNDGRTLSGVITERNPAGFKLTTQTDKIQIQQQDVDAIKESELSLMPDGLFDALTEQQKIDLLAYLMSNSN